MPYRPVVQKGWEELNIRDNPHGITVVSSVIWFTFHDLSGEIVCSKYRSGELKPNQPGIRLPSARCRRDDLPFPRLSNGRLIRSDKVTEFVVPIRSSLCDDHKAEQVSTATWPQPVGLRKSGG